jgi:hypothetical protein
MENVKVTVITLILCLMSITSFGREQYNTYRSPLLNEKIFDIDISYKSSGEYTLYVQMISMDKLLDDGGIMINNVYHELFLSKLNEAKVKYVEWSLTAKENNVINFSKLMEYKVRVGSYFKYDGNGYEIGSFTEQILKRGSIWSGTQSCHVWNIFEGLSENINGEKIDTFNAAPVEFIPPKFTYSGVVNNNNMN